MGNEHDQASEEDAEDNKGDPEKEAHDRCALQRRKEGGCERRQDLALHQLRKHEIEFAKSGAQDRNEQRDRQSTGLRRS